LSRNSKQGFRATGFRMYPSFDFVANNRQPVPLTFAPRSWNHTCSFPAYGSSSCLWLILLPPYSPYVLFYPPTALASWAAGIEHLLPPLLHALSRPSSLL
jgi:hypothetical protein